MNSQANCSLSRQSTMRVNTVEMRKSSPPPTKLSTFLKFLVKIRFLPVTISEDEGKMRFRFMSRRTLEHIVLYLVSWTLWTTFYFIYLWDEAEVKKLQEAKTTSFIEKFCAHSSGGGGLTALFPLLLARGLDNVHLDAVWDHQISFPKHGLKTISCFLWILVGSCLGQLGYLLQFDLASNYIYKAVGLTLICM